VLCSDKRSFKEAPYLGSRVKTQQFPLEDWCFLHDTSIVFILLSKIQHQGADTSGQQQKEIDCDEPHPAPNEKTQPIQWTERPTGALVAVNSL